MFRGDDPYWLAGPAECGQPLEHGLPLLPGEEKVEWPGVDRAKPGLGHRVQGNLINFHLK